MTDPTPKPRVEIEAPSKEQIAAAKKRRREQEIPFLQKPDVKAKDKRRPAIEGMILMIMATVLLYFFHSLGPVGWVLAALPFFAGVIVMLKSWQ